MKKIYLLSFFIVALSNFFFLDAMADNNLNGTYPILSQLRPYCQPGEKANFGSCKCPSGQQRDSSGYKCVRAY